MEKKEKKARKTRKGKKILGMLLIAVIVIIVIVVAIIMIVRKVNEGDAGEQTPEQTVVSLPDTTYKSMEVTDVSMEYLESQNQTMVSMSILNTTSTPVENESLNAILVGANGEVLGQMQTWIQSLAVGEQYDISVILNGNLTGTQAIQLQPVTN